MINPSESLDFATNFNTEFNTDPVVDLVRENPGFILSYADYTQSHLREFLAGVYQVSSLNIYLGAGTTDLLFALPRIIRKEKAIVPVPTFWEYNVVNQNAGKKVIKIPANKETKFQISIEKIQSQLDNLSAVYLCNPNNPTSVLLEDDLLRNIILENPTVTFVVDETYLMFHQDYERRSLVQFSTSVNNLFTVTSFSKFYAIPGLRIGMLTSSKSNIQSYETSSTPYLLSPLADIVVPALFSRKDENEIMRQSLMRLRLDFAANLSQEFAGTLKIYDPEANFILIEILNSQNSPDIVKQLHNQGIIVRDGTAFTELGEKWFRVAVRSKKENDHFISVLKLIMYRTAS